MSASESTQPSHFVRTQIEEDLAAGKNESRVHTRFPPEPNGYLHIGHAKSICLNFGMAREFGGKCNLRFDDTNPEKESTEYVNAIREDVAWLGFDWESREFYASDYFGKLHDFAVSLIRQGKAYVCELSPEAIREYRGTLTEPGKNSPYRDRSVEENLALFEKMKAGGFDEGQALLRAKIDMNSPNVLMRDPAIYRVRKVHHHRTGDAWCIYPMYDFTHCISDAIEGITHSLCTLEFENNRELYDWVLDNIESAPARPRQYEFARLNLNYTVLSKRKLIQLVNEGHVTSWDDPRMPTLSGLRRRGIPAAALRTFCEKIGLAKRNSTVDLGLFEHCVRDDLNEKAVRRMGVLNPVKLVITNYPEDQVEWFEGPNHPGNPDMGTREVPFSKELWIEREDFMEDAPKKFFRLTEGREVRLRFAYLVTCTGCVKDENGEITEVHCTYDPATKGGNPPDGRKVKGTIHWVAASHAVDAEVRLYDRLFTEENPDAAGEGKTFLDCLNPDALKVLDGCKLEPTLKSVKLGDPIQFERMGYFCLDKETTEGAMVFNRTITLRDTWAKLQKK